MHYTCPKTAVVLMERMQELFSIEREWDLMKKSD